MKKTDLFTQDAQGRTVLFHAALKGDMERVRQLIFSLPGTGLGPARLGLISVKDKNGMTAIDAARQNGHTDVADLLSNEKARMELFE